VGAAASTAGTKRKVREEEEAVCARPVHLIAASVAVDAAKPLRRSRRASTPLASADAASSVATVGAHEETPASACSTTLDAPAHAIKIVLATGEDAAIHDVTVGGGYSVEFAAHTSGSDGGAAAPMQQCE
jgi:hypothetical protein